MSTTKNTCKIWMVGLPIASMSIITDVEVFSEKFMQFKLQTFIAQGAFN